MLFLGTVPSPSYLAELRALRLAAATCDRSPNRALVLKFAVIEDVSRDRIASPVYNYIFVKIEVRRAQCFIRPLHPNGRDPGREPMRLVRGGPIRERDDRVPVSELRPGENRPLRALPRSVRRLPMPGLLVPGPLRCTMGSVAVTFRIMPDDAEADLERIKSRVRTSLAGSLRDLREQPVAFGVKAILAIAVVSDSGGTEPLEQTLAAIPGVGSVETVDVTLV